MSKQQKKVSVDQLRFHLGGASSVNVTLSVSGALTGSRQYLGYICPDTRCRVRFFQAHPATGDDEARIYVEAVVSANRDTLAAALDRRAKGEAVDLDTRSLKNPFRKREQA